MYYINVYMRFIFNKILPGIMSKMNARTQNFLQELEQIKTSHPNIYTLWKSYIDIRLSSLERIIQQGENMLLTSKNIPDISKEGIFFLMAMSNIESST